MVNIFITDISPLISAQSLDDKRVVKMVLESAQLLSSAIFINTGFIYSDIYRPTHLHHPCTLWVAANRKNWLWLFEHFKALCQEYSFRYLKKHKSEQLTNRLYKYSFFIKNGELNNFVNCTRSKKLGIDLTNYLDTIQAYREYLIFKWDKAIFIPKWKNRLPPKWYITTK